MNAQNMSTFHGSPIDGAMRLCEAIAQLMAITGILRGIRKAMRYGVTGLLSVTCFTLFAITAVNAKGRVALLLGAEKYQHFKASAITVGQNEALEKALSAQGFDVVLVGNPGNAAARAALSEFARKAKSADFALIVASGHFATYRRQSFFLPTNARVRRATDLFSRGLSVANLANIAQGAKAGALLLMMTVPDISSTIAGIGAQPDLATPPPGNVVAVFSTSTKVPVSRVDSLSVRAMKDVVEVAGEKPMTLAALVDGASAGRTGRVIGEVKDANLSEDASKPKPAKPEPAADDERKARELAEARLNAAMERARLAEQRARAAENKAKEKEAQAAAALEAERRAAADKKSTEERAKRELAEAAARKAEAERRKAEAERKLAAANSAPAQPLPSTTPPPAPPSDGTNIQSLQVVEALLGRGQRRVIQRILKAQGFYDGPIDAIFGERTRTAIKDFQRSTGSAETGYLTPEQLQELVASR